MKRQLPKHVYLKKGVVYFQRRGCPTVKIAAPPGTAEFHIEYARLLAGERPIYSGPKTFAALIADYRQSKRFRKLAPRTARDYDGVLEWITRAIGPLSVAKMQRKDVIRARDGQSDRMRFANYIVQVLRILFEHSIDLGWRDVGTNPAKDVTLLKSEGPKREAWPDDKIAAYRATATGRALLIGELCIGTGQRIGDVLKMRWSDIENGGIWVTQGKTGTKLFIPFTPRLANLLSETPRIGITICAWGCGQSTEYRGAADLIMAVRKRIGAEAWDIHSWRYNTTAELAAAGCSDELIQSVTGHKTTAMVVRYAGAARQRARAKEAQEKRK